MRVTPQPLRFSPTPLTMAVAMALTLAASQAPLAYAQDISSRLSTPVAIHLPAQPLGQALNALARQANVPMTFPAELAAGKQAPTVSGKLTLRQAVDALLAGSGLVAVIDAKGVVVKMPAQVSADPVQQLPAVVVSKREHRISKGATGLPLEIKDTPQSISTISQEDMRNFGFAGVNDALWLSTGLNVDQYETNRATFNSRGFEVQLTQTDGLGMSNSWGTVVGQQDTYLFNKIELIRGANGLLTGVGNASGTINYVRKRPTNKDGGEVQLSVGEYGLKRIALDYNKVLSKDNAWAGRLVVAHDDKDSHLRALNDKRTSIYGVLDGQIGENGMLTLGVTHQNHKQTSPMWGSLTLKRSQGGQAQFDVASSTSQDWTYWNTESTNAFVEYTHSLSPQWEAKLTYNVSRVKENTRLLYAYAPSGSLNADNTGLIGWPYRSHTRTDNDLLDINLSGGFDVFGREHSLIAGVSHSTQKTATDTFAPAPADMFLPLPAFPYQGNVYREPSWGPQTPNSGGEQKLTRVYGASRLALTDSLKAIVGVNAVKLARAGNSVYGPTLTTTQYPNTKRTSPYLGLTYDFSPTTLGYASYSEIFLHQDQADIHGRYLDPTKGVNHELGVKAEWFDRALLTSFAWFGARQQGLAEYAGLNSAGQYYYAPADVKSRGFEVEVTGRVGKDSNISAGLTQLKLTGANGQDVFKWAPRTTVNLRYDTRLPQLPGLKLGVAGRWQSGVESRDGVKQPGYFVANAFAAYELSNKASVRLNIYNLFDKKYLGGLAYGAIYGAPRHASLTLEYKL